MQMFDTYLMVDWSAAASPADWPPGADSIWWAAVQDGHETVVAHEQTRSDAIAHLTRFLRKEVDEERSVLVGFDFAFGYPSGFAQKVTGKDSSIRVWEWLSNEVVDDAKNGNNRFSVAGDLNEILKCKCKVENGPFWGYSEKKGHLNPGVPTHDPYKMDNSRHRPWPKEFGFAYRRVTDNAPGAHPVWKLLGHGAVGSQALLGQPVLRHLRSKSKSSPLQVSVVQGGVRGRGRRGRRVLRPRCAVWPFDTGGFKKPDLTTGKSVVLAEIYPSLLRSAVEKYSGNREILDRAQVRLNALAFSLLGEQSGGFDELFVGPTDDDLKGVTREDETPEAVRKRIASEEGWILGFGHEKTLLDLLDDHFRAQAQRHQADHGKSG